MIIEFEPERETKRTWRFKEIVEDKLDEEKIGTIYVQKRTLRELGWDGGKLTIRLELT
jgi:hypothetical protein